MVLGGGKAAGEGAVCKMQPEGAGEPNSVGDTLEQDKAGWWGKQTRLLWPAGRTRLP